MYWGLTIMKPDWRIPVVLLIAWVVLGLLAIETGSNVLRVLEPIILVVMLGYLIVCTLVVLFSKKKE